MKRVMMLWSSDGAPGIQPPVCPALQPAEARALPSLSVHSNRLRSRILFIFTVRSVFFIFLPVFADLFFLIQWFSGRSACLSCGLVVRNFLRVSFCAYIFEAAREHCGMWGAPARRRGTPAQCTSAGQTQSVICGRAEGAGPYCIDRFKQQAYFLP